MPTVTVYTMGGSAVWGPQRVESPFLVEELAGLLDKPVGSPGLKLAHGDAVLEPDEDLGRLPDPADVRVQYDPPKPFDRSFCREMATLAHSACDQVFFTGDVIAAGELEIPGAQTVRVEVLDDDIPSLQLNVRLRIPEGSPLISSASGDEVELRLTEIKLHSEEAVKEDDLDAHLVKGTIEERGGGSLLVSAELALEFDDSCELYDVEVVDGPLFQLMQRHASKAVREGVSSQTGAVPTELAGTLNRLIDELKSGATPDYHPGSNGVVCDIVHPSLYPFVEGTSVVTGLPGSSAKVGGYPEGRKTDMWGRNYEGSKYQWLPSEVSVSAAGKCTFDTYINNLDSATQRPLYAALESLLGRCLPLLEASWAHGSATCDDNMNDDRFTSDPEDGDPAHLEEKSLRGRTIQVITKIVDYELPGGGKHNGVWHVEGMSHENIVATAEFILRKDSALSGGDLEFQRAFSAGEGSSLVMSFPQMRPRQLDSVTEAGLVPLGQLPLPAGRLASWPNSHVHRVTELRNTAEVTATRRIVVFWLVNPEVRIVSTKNVAPQQGIMSLEDARAHRLELMEERKRHKGNWNLRTVTLCEH